MLAKFYQIDEVTGLSIHIGKEGGFTAAGCRLQRKDKSLSIEKKAVGVITLTELPKYFETKIPVALNLSGRGILYKQIPGTNPVNEMNFSSVLPNADYNEFYIQNFISGENCFVALIRRAEAEKWMEELERAGYQPVMLSLGPFPIDHILSQLNHYGGELVFNGYRVNTDENQQWKRVETNTSLAAPFPLKIDVEKIEEELLIPYASAFQVILADRLEPISANADGPEGALAQLISTKKLKAKGVLILAVFFVILLVNFIVFSSLLSANEQLAVRVSRTVQTTIDVGKLKEDIQSKTALLTELGWERGINKGLLIDQLAALLPREITLKEIGVDPVDEDAIGHGNQKIRFRDREIRVSGNATLVTTVNEWMARVKTRPWVKTVQLQNYNFNSEQNIGQFVVRINY